MTSPIGVGIYGAMRHIKHYFAVVQHLIVKITTIISIRGFIDSQKPSNSLNLIGLFEKLFYKEIKNKGTTTIGL
jgi:hypothetical protein